MGAIKRVLVGVVLAGVAAMSLLGGTPASARQEPNSCVHPAHGDDLNAIYGVSEQIIASFCPEADAGEQWTRPGAPWLMNTSFEIVPPGFVPAGATPLDDLVAKFVSLTYVIDRGTPQETILVFTDKSQLWTENFEGLPAFSTVTLGLVHPLSVGTHTVETFWELSAMHCDGLGDDLEANCLPAGQFAWTPPTTFDVVPRSAG